MIERSWLVEADVGQMCAKSAHVQNLHTCEHARIRNASDQGFILRGRILGVGKASHLAARQVCRAGDPA